MQENIYNRQDGQAVAANDSTKKESESKESKTLTDKDAKVIRKFLESVTLYEADALRIAICFADEKASADTLSSDDQLALNRYLNYGLAKEQSNDQQIQTHRIKRASSLSKRTIDFCGKHQILNVYDALTNFAINAKFVEQTRISLDKVQQGK